MQHSERSQGSLPSKTVTSPKEHVKAITLRSGTVWEQPQEEKATTTPRKDELEKEKTKRSKAQRELQIPAGPSPYDPLIPFPQRLRKQIRISNFFF